MKLYEIKLTSLSALYYTLADDPTAAYNIVFEDRKRKLDPEDGERTIGTRFVGLDTIKELAVEGGTLCLKK